MVVVVEVILNIINNVIYILVAIVSISGGSNDSNRGL